jgi:hypothetical protein
VNSLDYYNSGSEDGKNRVGDEVYLLADITGNATSLNVNFIVNYTNISTGQHESKTIPADYNTTAMPGYNFYALYTLPFSGPYNISVQAEAGKTARKERINPSENYDIFVEYGTPEIKFNNPVYPDEDFYYILENQTFPFSITIKAEGGDLVNLSITLSTTNNSVMLYNNSVYTKNLGNILNGTSVELSDGNIITFESYGGTFLYSNATTTTYEYNHSNYFETLGSQYIIPPRMVLPPDSINIYDNLPVEIRFAGIFDGSAENQSDIAVSVTSLLDSSEATYTGLKFKEKNTTRNCFDEIDSSNVNLAFSSTVRDSNNDDGNLTKDGNETTKWIGSYSNEINYTLDNPKLIKEVVITASTLESDKETNITVGYAIKTDKSFEKQNITINGTKQNHTINLNGKYDFISITITGQNPAMIYETRIIPGVPDQSCFVFNTSHTVKRSGTHLAEITMDTTKGRTTKNSQTFFVNYGYPDITIKDNVFFNSEIRNFTLEVKAVNGDVAPFYINLSVLNLSVLNFAENETSNKSLPYIFSGNAEEINWLMNATRLTTEESRTTTLEWNYTYNTSSSSNTTENSSTNVTVRKNGTSQEFVQERGSKELKSTCSFSNL